MANIWCNFLVLESEKSDRTSENSMQPLSERNSFEV